MAEWTGRKQRRHSPTDPEASHRNQDKDDTPQAPETPGAVASPQHPGEVPDRSTVPGQYSIRVNDQYRICFTWADGAGASRVEFVNYHDE